MTKFKVAITFLLLTIPFLINANTNDDSHELKYLRVSIQSTEYSKSRNIEHKTSSGKSYIYGTSKSYNKKGEAIAGKLLAPYVEYDIKTKLAGGTYYVTVHYKIDEKTAPSDPKLIVGMDYLKTQEVDLSQKGQKSIKINFNVSILNGKNHTVKIWLPSEGVEINKIEVNKGLFKKK